MRTKTRKIAGSIREDYELRSYVTAGISTVINVAFFLYNVILAFLYHSAWNASICVYYLLLILMRCLHFYNERKWRKDKPKERLKHRQWLFYVESWLFLVMDLLLAVPISIMVLSGRTVYAGRIAAIAIAAYTTYKVIMAVWNYSKARKTDNLSLQGLRVINLKDAMVSVLMLQNTLITVYGENESMMILSAYTSAGILLCMIGISVWMVRKGIKFKNG